MKYFYAFIVLCCLTTNMFGQHVYGTTGLLHAPTAEMQKDKTILIGGSMIDHNIYRDAYWNAHDEYNPYTYNYYLDITIFPWLEVGYTCTLVKGIHGSSYWPQQTWGKCRLGASSSTRTVRFMAVCAFGRKAGGNGGHLSLCWVRMIRVVMRRLEAATLRFRMQARTPTT